MLGLASRHPPHPWPQVNLSAPVANTSCWDQPTLVPAASHKVDLFNGHLAGVLLTSIFVTALGDVTVAHLGTAEGRIFQVGWGVGRCGVLPAARGVCSAPCSAPLQMVLQRSSSYLLTLANFSLGEPAPVRGAMGLQSHSLFFVAGTKVSGGPGGSGAGAEPHVPHSPPLSVPRCGA